MSTTQETQAPKAVKSEGLRHVVVGIVRNQPDNVRSWDKRSVGGTAGYRTLIEFREARMFSGSLGLDYANALLLDPKALQPSSLVLGRDYFDYPLFAIDVFQVADIDDGIIPDSLQERISAIPFDDDTLLEPINVGDRLICLLEYRFNPAARQANQKSQWVLVRSHLLERTFADKKVVALDEAF